MNRFNKFKIISLVVIIAAIVFDIFFTKTQVEKIAQIKNEYLKTEIENVYVQKNEKINLAILTKNKIKKFNNLENIGVIEKDRPILILKDGKYGYIKSNGDTLIPLKYDAIGIFVDGKALAKKAEKIGVIDENGKVIVPFEYSEIYTGENNLFILKDDSEYFSYDLERKKSLDIDEIYKVNERVLIFSKENRFGVIGYDGKIIVPNEYGEISTFIDKIFIGYKDSKYSLYNLKNEKISSSFDFIEQLGNNEYRAGSSEIGAYAFLSEEVSTDEKYENIKKIDEYIYIGELKNNTSDVINLKLQLVKNISNKEIEKYISEMKKEKSNE
ncbi:MAG: WG repeat-containing protein [Cetobacterium sp.]|uniref:WG repeat-containing protein n=1 Tax=Cetobacterium sp. TaxID=2071632 RepID=UPI003F3CA7E2